MPNIEAITAALSDAVGQPVRRGIEEWSWLYDDMPRLRLQPRCCAIFDDGTAQVWGSSNALNITPRLLDKLHAASQIVRRMMEAQHG